MGTWGAGIFDDDFALDVRDGYRDLVIEKRPDHEAEEEMVSNHTPGLDDDHVPTFWIALALTQHDVGRLSDRVRDEALKQIGTGAAEAAFAALAEDDDDFVSAYRGSLARAKKTLQSPQPKRKNLRGPMPPPTTGYPWVTGGYYGFRAKDFSTVLHAQHVATAKELGKEYLRVKNKDFVGEPWFCLLNWFEDDFPPNEKLEGIPYVCGAAEEGGDDKPMLLCPILLKRGQFPQDAISFLDHVATPPNQDDTCPGGMPNWLHFASIIAEYKDGKRGL